MDIIGFITTGLIPYLAFRKTFDHGSKAIKANRNLLYYPQVRPLDLVAARIILEMATLSIVFVGLMTVSVYLQRQFIFGDLLMVLVGLSLAGSLGSAIGLFASTMGAYTTVLERILPMIMRPLFWLSGIFYTANELPLYVREILLWNPVAHAVEMVRGGWFQSYHAIHADPIYVLSWVLGVGYLGLLIERLARKRMRLT